jgi:hypothetical protein
MDADQIQSWCQKHPRPALVRVTTGEGQIQEVIVQGAWTKLAMTIHALQPELLEALNGERQLLRATRPNDSSADWNDEDPEPAAPQRERRTAPAPTIADIPITATDPETQRFALVAKLIADAYKHANEVAFVHLVDLVNTMTKRSESVERARDALHKAQIKQLSDQLKEAGQEPNTATDELTLQGLLGAVLAGAQQGNAEAATNGKAHS